MRQSLQQFAVALGIGAAGLVGIVSAQQTTTSTEVKNFEVISVDGNKLVARDATGTKELTVPPDFKFMVNGKPVSVSEVKPGMKGTATITTTTTVTPVRVTEVRNGEVLQASGNSLLVKTADGIKMFNPGDMQKRNVTIMKDGKAVDFSSLHTGDRLSATIITEGPPKVMTQRSRRRSPRPPLPRSPRRPPGLPLARRRRVVPGRSCRRPAPMTLSSHSPASP